MRGHMNIITMSICFIKTHFVGQLPGTSPGGAGNRICSILGCTHVLNIRPSLNGHPQYSDVPVPTNLRPIKARQLSVDRAVPSQVATRGASLIYISGTINSSSGRIQSRHHGTHGRRSTRTSINLPCVPNLLHCSRYSLRSQVQGIQVHGFRRPSASHSCHSWAAPVKRTYNVPRILSLR